MDRFDELRIRLGRADENGRRAWQAATGLARRGINAAASGNANVDATLALMRTELEATWRALQQLEEVHELLARAAGRPPSRRVSPLVDQKPCVVCERVDAIVPVAVCARCSGLEGTLHGSIR